MNEGKILHFDPDASWTSRLEYILRNTNHSVIGAAHTGRDALEALDRVAARKLDVNLVIMSATMYPDRISRRINQLGLTVRTMFLSGQPNATESTGVDVDAEVLKTKWETVPGVIDSIPNPEA